MSLLKEDYSERNYYLFSVKDAGQHYQWSFHFIQSFNGFWN